MNDLTTTGGSPGGLLGFLSPGNERIQRWLGWVPVGLLAAGIYVWLLPIIYATAVMTLKFALVGAALAVIGACIASKPLRFMLGYLFQRVIGLLVSQIIDLDPVGIMEAHQREAIRQERIILDRTGDLRGVLEKTKSDLENDKAERSDQESILLAAKKKNLEGSLAAETAAGIIAQLDASVERLEGEVKGLESLISTLERYGEFVHAIVERIAFQIKHTKRERERMKISTSAFKAAAQIMRGESIGAQMYADASDRSRMQTAAMLGQIKQFVAETAGDLDRFELSRAGSVEQVLARLERRQATLQLEHQTEIPVIDLEPQPEKVAVAAMRPSARDFLKS